MPKMVILGSCKHEPYVVLAMPNKLNPKMYNENHKKAYEHACKYFYPAIDNTDIIIVYCPDGIGKHTQKDINYAKSKNKKIVYVK